ncbi:MAG: hypothetical protein DCC67_08765 [Planctomycetota bacterium]|nr:MAG: hypothetical protein DCC67_08765 [Planctomycetota bacterium]
MIEANLSGLLSVLSTHGVEYIVIGGGAGVLMGLARTTLDVDIVYSRDLANMQRLVAALQEHRPYLRGAPPGLPFRWDVDTLRRGLNFTLVTDIGNLDLLGEVVGGGDYRQLLPFTKEISAFGITFRVVTLEQLIRLKRAAGRPKDLEVIAELEALLEELAGGDPPAGG